jgi:hypothetical protein
MAVRDRFGQRVRQSAGTDVVNQQDRIRRTLRPAAIDDLLRAALNLRIAALHRREIEIRRTLSAADRGRRAAAQTDQHRRAAEHHQRRADHDVELFHIVAAHIAETARDHDGLVIAPDHGAAVLGRSLFEGTEITAGGRPAELIVERRGAQGRGDHDVERRGNPFRLAEIHLPRLQHARNAQIRYRKSRQAGLGFGAQAGRALIANLAAGPGGGSGKGRNGRGMIVRLDLHQDVDRLDDAPIALGVGVREKPQARGPSITAALSR